MAFQIIGAIRHGLETFTGVLPEGHGIPEDRIASFLEAGLLEEVEVVVKKRSKPKNIARIGKFDLDPDGLRGLSIERLNALVAERGAKDKFVDATMAIQFLSRHFNPERKAIAKPKRQVVVYEDDEPEVVPSTEEPLVLDLDERDAAQGLPPEVLEQVAALKDDAPPVPVTAMAAPNLDFVAALKESPKKE